MLKPLGRERFMTLITNWHRGVHGKFKVPIFAHQELDLYRVFWSVMDKGGYEIVSANKQWKVRSYSFSEKLIKAASDCQHVHCVYMQLMGSCTHRADCITQLTELHNTFW